MARRISHPARGRPARQAAERVEGDPLDVAVVLIDGNHASTAIGPIEVFQSAGQLWNSLRGEAPVPRFRVTTASIDGRSVRCIGSIGLLPQCAIGQIERADIVVVSASGLDLQQRLDENRPLMPWLREWHGRGACVAGICSGVAFLAEAGLLDGRQATTHWAIAALLRERYPRVDWQPEMFVTDDGRVLCSGGVYASIDLSLYLVERFCGREIALQCAKSLLVSMPRSHQSGYAVLPLSRPHEDERIRRVEQYLHVHFAENVSIAQLAKRAGMGPRNFIRRFKAATGRLPGDYLQNLRVAAAKRMLEDGARSIERVSLEVGYQDVAFFRAVFKRCTGMTPGEYRSRFAGSGCESPGSATARCASPAPA